MAPTPVRHRRQQNTRLGTNGAAKVGNGIPNSDHMIQTPNQINNALNVISEIEPRNRVHSTWYVLAKAMPCLVLVRIGELQVDKASIFETSYN